MKAPSVIPNRHARQGRRATTLATVQARPKIPVLCVNVEKGRCLRRTLCRMDVKAPLHLIDKTIVFVDLTLHPIKLLLLQVVHCEDDRDKIDCRYQ